jgi:hypothetical protein
MRSKYRYSGPESYFWTLRQTWPPQESPQARAIREASLERMRQSMRPGTIGGGGGGGSYRFGPGGRIEYGTSLTVTGKMMPS